MQTHTGEMSRHQKTRENCAEQWFENITCVLNYPFLVFKVTALLPCGRRKQMRGNGRIINYSRSISQNLPVVKHMFIVFLSFHRAIIHFLLASDLPNQSKTLLPTISTAHGTHHMYAMVARGCIVNCIKQDICTRARIYDANELL